MELEEEEEPFPVWDLPFDDFRPLEHDDEEVDVEPELKLDEDDDDDELDEDDEDDEAILIVPVATSLPKMARSKISRTVCGW